MKIYDFIKSLLHEQAEEEIRFKSMSTDELIALDDDNLIDAVNVILYCDFDEDDIDKINSKQKVVLSILSFDCEVQGGGLCSFFVNSSSAFAPFVSDSLKIIGSNRIEKLYSSFIKKNNIDVNDLSSFKVDDIDDYEKQTERYDFDTFDDEYIDIYEKENLNDLLLPYIRKNAAEIFSEY